MISDNEVVNQGPVVRRQWKACVYWLKNKALISGVLSCWFLARSPSALLMASSELNQGKKLENKGAAPAYG